MATYIASENEKEKYISKLDAQIQAIDRILKIDSGTVISAERKKQLRTLKTEAETILRKLENNEFEIAIVGEESSGKSTFANALMKNNILPRADKRCTYTATRISYSGDDEDDKAIVSFYSSDEFNSDFRDKLRQLGFPNYEKYSYDTLSEENYKKIYDKEVPDEIKERKNTDFIKSDIQTIIRHSEEITSLLGIPDKPFAAKDIENGDLEVYITDEVKALAVSKVIIRSKQLSGMKNAVIYDVPGFNSPTALHKQQTLSRMKSADAIIITAKGDEPSITEGPLKILQDSDDDGNPLQDKLFVFANKIERSTDVVENVQLIKDQWIKTGFVSVDKCDRRIYFGSALAYLQSIELCYDPDRKSRALREFDEKKTLMPCGFGIDELRQGLENYNSTERFEVLKRRVNRIRADILKVFKDICFGNEDITLSRSYSTEQVALVTDLITDTPPLVKKRLLDLKADIRSYIPAEQPLSKKIVDYISDNVTTEKYSISDELIDDAAKHSPYLGTHEDVARIEGYIRKIKFKEMYGDFSQNVINMADKHHMEYSAQILDIILKAMGVDSDFQYYDNLKELLKNEISAYRSDLLSTDHSNELYYQSLIERFSRYIYQVLITSQYSVERLRVFYDSIDNFYSLSVFYRKPGCENDLSYIDIAPKDQPLCMMLLFHHYFDISDSLRLLADDISRISGLREIPEDLMLLIKEAFFAVGKKDGIIEEVKKVISKQENGDKSDVFKINLLKQTFSNFNNYNEPCSVADKKAFTRYYEHYHSSLRGGKLYSVDDFRADFDIDIKILQDVLINAFVRAVSIEKPFVAREIKSIDDIIDYIQSKEFSKFLSTNFYKIKYKETQYLDKQHRIQEQNAAIISEISRILDSLVN